VEEMVTYDDLNSQNDRITELSHVLNKLLSDRGLCNAEVTCDLFFQYVENVQDHLKLEDRHIYRQMLTHRDQGVRNTATKFMSGQVEIKRVFASYLRKWCKKRGHELKINDYEQFAKETDEMFELVLDRIQDESENLFPLLREITGENHLLVA